MLSVEQRARLILLRSKMKKHVEHEKHLRRRGGPPADGAGGPALPGAGSPGPRGPKRRF
jgi:hypothetical protein